MLEPPPLLLQLQHLLQFDLHLILLLRLGKHYAVLPVHLR
jgi:hypothetical protein